jgi:hypothetical protein
MPPSAEQRRADTQVSRAVRDRWFEVAAHSGRDYACRRVALADRVGDFCKLSKRRFGVGAQRRYGHDACKFKPCVCSDGVGNRTDLFSPRAGATGTARLIEVDLHEAADGDILGSAGECIDQAQPVHRMNKARVPDDGRALVRLQRADEVPPQISCTRVGVSHLGNLGSGFLIAILTHIPHAEFCEQHDVRGRECLRDRDERDVIDGALGGAASVRDALLNVLEILRELVTPRITGLAGRSHVARQIKAPIRPVTLSRR